MVLYIVIKKYLVKKCRSTCIIKKAEKNEKLCFTPLVGHLCQAVSDFSPSPLL